MSDSDPDKVVSFPGADEERARRLRVEVERLSKLPTIEWQYLVELPGYAEKFGIDKAPLKGMVETVLKEEAHKYRAEEEARRQRQQRDDKKAEAKERKQERAEREKRRTEQAAKKEAEKAAAKKEKERLAALNAILKLPASEHAVRLQQLARRLGDPLDTLQAEFEQLLADEAAAIEREAREPWPEPVSTKELLDDVLAQLRRYVVIHDEAAATIYAVTVLFAWVHDEIATFSPNLVVQGADTEVAKSLLCRIHSMMAPRPCLLVKPTGPSIYRLIDHRHPTTYIDNADKLLAEDRDLADVVNSSWMRGFAIPRVVEGSVYQFDPFCFKVINGINVLRHLDDAARTRCIVTEMLPKLPHEKITHLKFAASDERFAVLRRKLMRWAKDNTVAIRDATPAMPEGFVNRLEENYALLFAIADLAGGAWSKKMRHAAVKLSSEFNIPSLGRWLLAIFFDLFCKHGVLNKRGRLLLVAATVEAVLPSYGDEWANYKKPGHAINQWQIAELLQPFNIRPGVVHPINTSARGYDAEWFAIKFKHYLGKSLPPSAFKK
jgi:hypothetical protein